MFCKVTRNLKDFPVGAFNAAVGSRVVGCNKCLLNVTLSPNIPKDLIRKFHPITTKEKMKSRVGADQMKNNGMSHYSSRLIR